jgi:predicted ATP-binding protein involved in virulence
MRGKRAKRRKSGKQFDIGAITGYGSTSSTRKKNIRNMLSRDCELALSSDENKKRAISTFEKQLKCQTATSLKKYQEELVQKDEENYKKFEIAINSYAETALKNGKSQDVVNRTKTKQLEDFKQVQSTSQYKRIEEFTKERERRDKTRLEKFMKTQS